MKIKTGRVVLGLSLILIEISVQAATKKGPSFSAQELSEQKLQIRNSELQKVLPESFLPEDRTRESPVSPYNAGIQSMRKNIRLKKNVDTHSFYTAEAPKVYQAARQFIANATACQEAKPKLGRNTEIERGGLLSFLLKEVDRLSDTQRLLGKAMGNKSQKNGSKEDQEKQDTNLIGNFPHPKFFLNRGDRKQTILRMGTQTLDDPKTQTAQVNPEFQSYISSLKKDEQHVYINLQMSSRWGFGDKEEIARSQAIHKLAGNNPSFVALSLDKNSASYQLAPRFNARPKAVINRLAERMFPADPLKEWPKTGINLRDLWHKDTGSQVEGCEAISEHSIANPEKCRKALKARFIQDMTEIATALFGDGKMSRNDVKALEDTAYRYVADRATHNATTVNMSCKSDVDRGGGEKAILFLTSLIKKICSATHDNKKGKFESIKKEILELGNVLFADAVLYNGRPMNDDRLGRFQSTARAMILGAGTKNGCSAMDKLFSPDSLELASWSADAPEETKCKENLEPGCEPDFSGDPSKPVEDLANDLKAIKDAK